MSITYGASIRWTAKDGTITTLTVGDFPTPEAAWAEVIQWAQEDGWTPPCWYEWHRRGDTQIPTDMTHLLHSRKE